MSNNSKTNYTIGASSASDTVTVKGQISSNGIYTCRVSLGGISSGSIVSIGSAGSTWASSHSIMTTMSVGTGATTFGTVSLERGTSAYYAPSFGDLIAGLRPGTPWFKDGAILRLNLSMVFYRKDQTMAASVSLEGATFVYLGVVEDLVMGQERHWFLTESGEMVQFYNYVGDLSWRENIKGRFTEVGESHGSAG